MISDKQIVCPNNLLDAASKKKGVSAAIVNAGKPLPMLSVMDAVKENLIKPIFVGDVGVGGDYPISIQSMTNTNTADVKSTVKQINELQGAGADIVRVSVPDEECASAFKEIKKQVSIPIVADIHFDFKIALLVANAADCLRINPGNIGKENKVQQIIQAAKDNNVPIRIGVNAGSLEKDLQKKYIEPNSERASLLTIGSKGAQDNTDSPVIAKSVHGEINTPQAGISKPSSRKFTSEASAKPPPAESPAITIFFALFPVERICPYTPKTSFSAMGKGASGAKL